MSVLWRFCQAVCQRGASRKKLFLTLNTVFFGLVGLTVWLILRQWVLSSLDWALVFAGGTGYCIGFLGGVLYLYNL